MVREGNELKSSEKLQLFDPGSFVVLLEEFQDVIESEVRNDPARIKRNNHIVGFRICAVPEKINPSGCIESDVFL